MTGKHMMPGKISIITAVYNNAKYIETALKSIQYQSYKNIEHIIIDGGSTDGTLELLQSYLTNKTKLISEPDKGIYDALNKGISQATGDIIGFLHSDDLLAHPDTLAKISQEFKQNSVEAVYGDLLYVDQNNLDKTIRHWKSGNYSLAKIEKGWMPPHPTFYMKRSCYEEMLGFQLKYKIAADYEALIRYLWKNKITCSYIPEILVKMRIGGLSNSSFKNILLKSKEDYQIIRKYRLGGISTLMLKNFRKIHQFFP